MKKAILSKEAPQPIGPYSQAILSGDTIYISGQIPVNPESGLMVEGVENQCKQVMQNIGAILKSAGMDFSNIVKTSIFLDDMGTFTKVNEIYGSYFKDVPPARETIEVAKLPLNALVEISAIAVK